MAGRLLGVGPLAIPGYVLNRPAVHRSYPVILGRVKTAVSIPDEVFEQAEQLARRTGVSRSELYAVALRALLAGDAEITKRLNRIHHTSDRDRRSEFVATAARRSFAASDW